MGSSAALPHIKFRESIPCGRNGKTRRKREDDGNRRSFQNFLDRISAGSLASWFVRTLVV
jgi:hypothetical protein